MQSYNCFSAIRLQKPKSAAATRHNAAESLWARRRRGGCAKPHARSDSIDESIAELELLDL